MELNIRNLVSLAFKLRMKQLSLTFHVPSMLPVNAPSLHFKHSLCALERICSQMEILKYCWSASLPGNALPAYFVKANFNSQTYGRI